MAKKLRRKDLKQPDEFMTLTQRALTYARENERQVVLVTAGVVLVIGLALAVRTYREWQVTAAREALASAYRDFAAGRFEEAATGLREVRSRWPGTAAGELAGVYAGNALAELGKVEEAREVCRSVAEGAREPSLRQIALYNLGVLGRKAGDDEEAERQLHLAVEIEGPLRGAAWLAAGSGEGSAKGMPDGISADVRAYLQAKRGG
ncbi:MAG: tetratricopeptide repeat protein [bacterium]